MLVVRIELHSARTGKVTEIGRTYISNVTGVHGSKLSDYRVRVCRKKSLAFTNNPLRWGEVKGYPRLRLNVWKLVIRGLLSAFPDELKRLRK
jgi:hypothetical protein